jgi:hypothetical protein
MEIKRERRIAKEICLEEVEEEEEDDGRTLLGEEEVGGGLWGEVESSSDSCPILEIPLSPE